MKDGTKQVQRNNISLANDRVRRRNYIFEFNIKLNTRGGLESDTAQALCDYNLCFTLTEDCSSKYCNCLPGLSVKIKHWNFNNKTFIQGSRDT